MPEKPEMLHYCSPFIEENTNRVKGSCVTDKLNIETASFFGLQNFLFMMERSF